MPDEILKSMENEIIKRYTEKLKEIIFSDARIHKTDAIHVNNDIDETIKRYNRLYP